MLLCRLTEAKTTGENTLEILNTFLETTKFIGTNVCADVKKSRTRKLQVSWLVQREKVPKMCISVNCILHKHALLV